jgi:tetratricopeptide (TPR) repeat protein
MRSMVSNYPDDIEARTIYGILVYEFTKDTTKAFAQFDSALAINPTYQLPQDFRSEIYISFDKYDEAIRIAEKTKREHPDSPNPYALLASAYLQQGKRDLAEREFDAILARFPKHRGALANLIRLAIYRRDFAKATALTENYKQLDPGNLYDMVDYYEQMATLAIWNGKFRAALQQYDRMADAAKQLGDSGILANTLQTVARGYLHCGITDTGLKLYEESYRYRTANMFSNYALVLVEHDHSKADQARKMFREDIAQFKSRIPSELWGITDGLEKIFEGLAKPDTVLLLEGYRDLIKTQQQGNSGNDREMAYILIRRGSYQEGIDILKRFVSGQEESSGGIGYPMALYYIGIGYEGLGNKAEATKYFSEMLKFWGNADIQIDEIKDAKARLAKLTS